MKGVFQKCGLFALLFVLSLTASFTLFSNSVNAASAYDDLVQPVDTLTVHYDRYGKTAADVTNDYLTYVTNCSGDYQISIANALENGNIGVYEAHTTIGGFAHSEVHVFWNEDKFKPVSGWSPTQFQLYFSNGDGAKHMVIKQNPSSNSSSDVYGTCDNIESLSSTYVMASANNYPFLATYDIDYPAGYEGELIPLTPGGLDPATMIKPNISVEVNDKTVSIQSKRHPLVDGDYRVYIFITNATFDDEPPEDWQPFSMDGYLEPDTWDTFTVPSYGDYIVTANFAGVDNEQSSFVPPVGYTKTQNSTRITLEGGFFGVDTDDMRCELSETPGAGFTCEYPTLEDSLFECSVTSLDGCIKNVMFYIADWLGFPMHQGSPMTGQISRYRSETFGLMPIIDAPITVFQRMATNTYTCAPMVLDLDRFGMVTVPCLSTVFQRSGLAPFYTVFQTIINGIVAYWVIVRLFNMVKDFQNPADDRIEVAKL